MVPLGMPGMYLIAALERGKGAGAGI